MYANKGFTIIFYLWVIFFIDMEQIAATNNSLWERKSLITHL